MKEVNCDEFDEGIWIYLVELWDFNNDEMYQGEDIWVVAHNIQEGLKLAKDYWEAKTDGVRRYWVKSIKEYAPAIMYNS